MAISVPAIINIPIVFLELSLQGKKKSTHAQTIKLLDNSRCSGAVGRLWHAINVRVQQATSYRFLRIARKSIVWNP